MKTKTKEIFDGAIFLLLTIALNVGMFYLRYKVVLENSEILFIFLGFLQVIFGVVFLVVSGIRNEETSGNFWCYIWGATIAFGVIESAGWFILFLNWVHFYIMRL